jgi:hypothetical protein
MGLKYLISLKFVVYIVFITINIILINQITGTYNVLKKENKVLSEQKKIYEKILHLDSSDKIGKYNLYKNIEVSNLLIKDREEVYSIDKLLYVYTIFWILYINILRGLNDRIKIKKIEVHDKGELI